MGDLSPLSFCENIRQSIEVPIRYLMKMTSRAVVFELLVSPLFRDMLLTGLFHLLMSLVAIDEYLKLPKYNLYLFTYLRITIAEFILNLYAQKKIVSYLESRKFKAVAKNTFTIIHLT